MGDDRYSSAAEEGRLNQEEAKFGSPMTAREVAEHFEEKTPITESVQKIPTTEEEIKEWEKKQDNSNDIYKISARVKNLARAGGASLTPVGDMLCNTYIHVLKAFYDFAEKLPESHRQELIDLVRSKEGMPADMIAATKASVKG